MKSKTKNRAKITTATLATLLVVSLGTSSILASAANTSANGRYYSDYTSEEVAIAEAEKMNKELASEGIVMLKNDGSLPIAKGSKVSVLGVAQDCMVETSGSITDSLTAAGLTVNPTLEEFYTSDSADYSNFGAETTLSGTQKQSLRLYNDLAVVVIARGTEGESSGRSYAIDEYDEDTYLDEDTGWTHEAHNNDGEGNEYKHELQLTDSEQELIKLAEQNCKKVVVLYSASYTFEMADLQSDENINGIYWIGRLGDGGVDAIGEILTGEINPSGKTVDEWTRDFTNDPTYANSETTDYVTDSGESSGYNGIDYEEDIYLGYKYYETYWYEASLSNASPTISGETASADAWYNYNVVYPFGYGLSYTDFSFELEKLYDNNGNTIADGGSISADSLSSSTSSAANITTLYADVNVTNIGDVAGKETVQVYITAPYKSGETEKAYYTLVGYVKTSEIAAGASETVTVAFNVQDFASYDYSDANNDGHEGYELDTGTYTVHVMNSSSHSNFETEAYASQTFVVSGDEAAYLDIDDYSGNEIENLFSNGDDFDSMAVSDVVGSMTLLSRADFDGTKPEAPADDELTLTAEAITLLGKYEYIDAEYTDDSQYVWYKTSDDIPDTWTQNAGTVGEDGFYALTLDDMAGEALYNADGSVTTAWTTFMNQLTWEDFETILNNGSHLTAAIDEIGKLETNDENGPNYTWATVTWVGEPTVAATWNTELCARYGMMVGNIALFQGMSGWYGPGMNTHRNQFNGRNPEYYSQDSIQGGYIAAAVVGGAQATGINVYVKHFALYDASVSGNGSVNISEQNMRENYLKVFQMAMQEGDASAAMSAFPRIGYVYCCQNYNLNQALIRDEWGWTGFIVTDATSHMAGMTVDALIRSGAALPDGDMNGNTYSYTNSEGTTITGDKTLSGEWDAENNCVLVNGEENATQWYWARTAVMTILYNEANSAGNYNGVTDTVLAYDVEATQGVELSTSVIPEKYSDPDAGYTIGYSVVSGELPTGLTIDSSGNLTGTPMVSGTYTVTVELTIDYWITIELDLNIEVASIIGLEDGTDLSSLSTGDKVDCYVEYDNTTSTVAYSSLTYTIAEGSLPDGLTLASDGRITGTATTAGTYEFTVLVSAIDGSVWKVKPLYNYYVVYMMSLYGSQTYDELVATMNSLGMESYVDMFFTYEAPLEYYFTYTITVTGEEVATSVTVESVELNTDGDLVVTYTDGTSTTIEMADVSTSVDADASSDGESSGCSGSISANIATIVAMLTVAGAAVVVLRKRKAQN